MSTRRYPFDVLTEMERMMESMRRSMYDGVDDVRSMTGLGTAHMSLDRRDDGYVVTADIPGFEMDEIDLRFEDGELTVDASHEVTDESPAGSVSRSRRVHETLHIPGDIVVEDVSATYRNGVLEVSLPTLEEPEDKGGRLIDIN